MFQSEYCRTEQQPAHPQRDYFFREFLRCFDRSQSIVITSTQIQDFPYEVNIFQHPFISLPNSRPPKTKVVPNSFQSRSKFVSDSSP